ncbi:MAG: MFS transporter [Candidatus Bathyarchaeota archaeon]|nr:MFS transporter [Candidatus Bathyarchaeota archaeon]MDH5712895.1 MFS transporter [Candidatus Bathyarchaeota archaeon]
MSLVWFRRLKENLSYFRGNLLVLTLSWVFWTPAMVMVYTYEPTYILALGADTFIMGAIYGISIAVLCVTRIPGGFIADRFGRKWVIAIMSFGAALAYLPYAFAQSWQWILVAAILSSLTLIYQPALMAAFADSIPPEKRGKGYALSNFLPTIVAVFSPIIAGYFVLTRGLVDGMRLVYLLAAGSGLIAAFLRLFFLKETLPKREANPKEKDSPEHWRGFKTEYLGALKFIFKSAPLLLVLRVVFEFASYGSWPFFIVFAMEFLGVSEEGWWIIFMVSQAAYLVGAMPMGILTDRIGRRKVLILSTGIFILSTLFWVMTPPHAGLTMFSATTSFALIQLAAAASGSALPAFEADLIPRLKRGNAIATLMLVYGITTAVITTIGGFMYEEVAPQFPFLISIVLLSIVFPIILFRMKEPSKREV